MCECERLISGFMAHLGNKLGVQSVKLLGVKYLSLQKQKWNVEIC